MVNKTPAAAGDTTVGDPEPKAVLDTLTMAELQEMLRKDAGADDPEQLVQPARDPAKAGG